MPCPIVVVSTPEVLLAFEGLHKRVVFLAVVILGGLFFHAHLSVVLFFRDSFIFFSTFIFLAAGFFSFDADLLVLSAVPRHSFFNELISAVMAMIFSCSSVGFPHVFSLSKSRALYLFSAQTMRSSTATETYPKLVFFTLKKLRVFSP